MSQLNSILATQFIKKRLLDFCRADHYVNDLQVDSICQHVWGGGPDQGGLAGNLWVEAAFPPRSSQKTMRQHVESGLIASELAELLDHNGAFGLDWQLREIQAESIKTISDFGSEDKQPALVVSAGTGAGKTESFLFPMLDRLIREPKRPHEGCSAIILYPMNALVTDQVDRLTRWLAGQTRLRIFHFTGDTPEDHYQANQQGYMKVDQCAFRTRQEARGLETATGKRIEDTHRADQPDIIVTNYSMLEYMLCRPQDAIFFGTNFKHLVLDEAHLYSGNLAAEITMLLRRLAAKCGVETSAITHYATSATLVEGSEEEQSSVLRSFASKLFSKPSSQVRIILGQKAEPLVSVTNDKIQNIPNIEKTQWPDLQSIEEVDGEDHLVKSNSSDWKLWIDAFKALLPQMRLEAEADLTISKSLFLSLPKQAAFKKLYHLLYEKNIVALDELAEQLWGNRSKLALESTRRLLQAGAIARQAAGASPLLPNRIHWSIRAPSGLFFSFVHEKSPSSKQVYLDGDKPIGYFYSPGYSTRPDADKSCPLLALRNSSDGSWLLGGIERGMKIDVPEEAMPKSEERLEQLLERMSFFRLGGNSGTSINFDPAKGELGSDSGVSLRKVDRSTLDLKSIRPFGSDSRLQLVIIAEAALSQMPPFPGSSKNWKPAQGRRLLVFSDSRQEAAGLGPTLTNNHERQLFRALVTRVLSKEHGTALADLKEKAAKIEASLESVDETVRQVLEANLVQLSEQMEGIKNGQMLSEFSNTLAQDPIVKEFFDRETGERHRVDRWSQKAFENNRAEIVKSLKHRLSQELARRTLWPDLNLESSGILELVYPGLERVELNPGYIGTLPSEASRTSIEESLAAYLGTILDHARDRGSVTLGSDVADAEYNIGGGFIGKWASLETNYRSSLVSLMGEREETYFANFTKAYLRENGMATYENPTVWRSFVEAVFEALYEASRAGHIKWLEFDTRQSGKNETKLAFRVKFGALRIRRPLRLFQCSESGQVWPRSAKGLHFRIPHPTLKEVGLEDLERNPRIARARSEWSHSLVFQLGLWAEEHSAQIGPAENRRLQDLFKDGIRNVLSSTTTLELGIDIGGLNGVMMGNIPPGKANYLQRSGRAGRRADGSSLVISYARNTPYERKVFENFSAYLRTPISRPTVFLDRVDIITRHFNSLVFGYFFSRVYREGSTTGAMQAFSQMGRYANVPLVGYWKSGDPKPKPMRENAQSDFEETFPWGDGHTSLAESLDRLLDECIAGAPKELQAQVRGLLEGTPLGDSHSDELGRLFKSLKTRLKLRLESWTRDYSEILDQWRDVPQDGIGVNRARANALHYQLKQMYAMTVIENLSDCMILPRYGFPIGLSELKVNQGSGNDRETQPRIPSEAYRLNRSASQAIREYAPGSKLLVGSRILSSTGILKSWTGDDIPMEGMGLRAWFHWDEKSGRFQYQYTSPDFSKAQAIQSTTKQGQLLFVRHGFSTSASQRPTFGGKPRRVGEILNICQPPEDAKSIQRVSEFGGQPRMKASLYVGGELIAINSGEYRRGFAVCTKCGYAESEFDAKGNGREELPKDFEWHTAIHEANPNYNCWKSREAPVLRRLHLAARQVCDYLEIELPHVNGSSDEKRRIANTICQALRLSGCDRLNIDSRELSVLKPTSGSLTRISISDSLAGGSGHVRDLFAQSKEWWHDAVARIMEGTPTEATLNLLTVDVPIKRGLPFLSIDLTRSYLSKMGEDIDSPEIKSEESDTFDFNEVRKHLKTPKD